MQFKPFSPRLIPAWFFAGAILAGTLLLHLETSQASEGLSWLDALFTATSAMCVTGLIVVDTGSFFTTFGQSVILVLIQIGGLGIMTYTTLAFYLFRRRVSLSDRIAVGDTLLHDPSFHLTRFILRIVAGTLMMEAAGAVLLYLFDPRGFHPYSAIFHSVSAFCNAGFALQADSLMGWRANIGINTVFMILIILGGIGFAVLDELRGHAFSLVRDREYRHRFRLSHHARVVLNTSGWLIAAGAVFIFLAEWFGGNKPGSLTELGLASLFQSVTCRTAGFNTLDTASMTNLSLVFMMGLMFIGGSPGSCAGGIKTTTFRAWWGFISAQFNGREQTRVGRFALSLQNLSTALTLMLVAIFLIITATLIMVAAEGGDMPHPEARGIFLEVLFETVSALGTVGLSTGLTPGLTPAGKIVTIVLMFLGRLGPIWLLTALKDWHIEQRYRLPETELPIG